MAPIPPERFRAALADLSREAFGEFVVALARARGRDARYQDGRLSLDGRTLLLHHPGRLGALGSVDVPTDADGVVTSARGRPRGVPDGYTVVDADALRERALYGVAHDARDVLFSEHLECEPHTADAGSENASRRIVHLAAAALAVLLVAAAVGLPAPPGGNVADVAPASGTEPDATTPTATDDGPTAAATLFATTTTASPTATPRPPPDDAYPPGLNATGIVDAGLFAESHARAVSGRAYRLSIDYQEAQGGDGIGHRRLTVALESRSRLRASLREAGNTFGFADPVPDTEVYGDGDTYYFRTEGPNGTVYRAGAVEHSGADEDPYANVVARYVERTVRPENTSLASSFVRDGTRLFRVRIEGTPELRVEATTGYLLVDASGVLHRIERSYRFEAASGLSGRVVVEYDFGPVRVTPPPWIDEARANTSVDGTGASGQ